MFPQAQVTGQLTAAGTSNQSHLQCSLHWSFPSCAQERFFCKVRGDMVCASPMLSYAASAILVAAAVILVSSCRAEHSMRFRPTSSCFRVPVQHAASGGPGATSLKQVVLVWKFSKPQHSSTARGEAFGNIPAASCARPHVERRVHRSRRRSCCDFRAVSLPSDDHGSRKDYSGSACLEHT